MSIVLWIMRLISVSKYINKVHIKEFLVRCATSHGSVIHDVTGNIGVLLGTCNRVFVLLNKMMPFSVYDTNFNVP